MIQTVEVPGESRAQVYVNAAAPTLMVDVDFWTSVTATQPVAVERLMYKPGPTPGTWQMAHGAPGMAQAALKVGFGEGVVGLGPGLETFLLLVNPSATQAVTLDATYTRGGGGTVVKSHTIPPMMRVTVYVNGEVPELSNEAFGVILASTNGVPLVADESVYWNGFTGGATTRGTPIP